MSENLGLGGRGPSDFFGRFRLRLDPKGRLTLPSLYRRALPADQAVLILRQGPEPFVQVIPQSEWRSVGDRRSNGKLSGARKRWQARHDYGGVEGATLDPKGRFTVPQALLKRNGIDREVLAVGVGRIMELWNPETFFALEAQQSVDSSEVEDLLYD